MTGAKVLSLCGRDTDLAIQRQGDPPPELPRFYGILQRIASEVPKLPAAELGS